MKLKPILATMVMVLAIGVQGQPGRAADMPSVKSNPAGKTWDPALATSPAAAIFGLKENKILLIDVRPQAEFDQYRIAGSLNIPLHAIKTKAYLKTKPIVLVNEGFVIRPLAETCHSLNKAGFKATILAGGLVAWKHKRGKLIGDPFGQIQMNRITARLLDQEKEDAHLMLIDASDPVDHPSGILLPGTRRVSLLEAQKGARALKKIIKAAGSDPFARLVIFTTTGKENEHIQRRLARAGIGEAYFLEGGMQAYEKHLQQIQMARRPAAERKFTTGGCKSCVRDN